MKTTNVKRLSVDPPCGILEAKETIIMAVSCDPFNAATENLTNDRITIEWANAPEDGSKKFHREWFQGDIMIRRRNLPIEYNV